jgi:hypothetical protein
VTAEIAGGATPPARRVPSLRFRASTDGLPLGAIFTGIGLLLGLAVVLLHLDRLPFAFCTFKALTGLPCMTCGTTRALGRLVALDPVGALLMNPLATLGGLVLVMWGVADLLLMTRGRALAVDVSPGLALGLRVTAVVLLLLNWLYLLAAGR